MLVDQSPGSFCYVSVSMFSPSCDQIPARNNLREGRFRLAHGSGDTVHPALEVMAAGLALFIAAGACFLTSLWNSIHRKGNTAARRLSLLPFSSEEDPVSTRD